MKEVWKDIPESNGRYQVSNCGRVKSIGGTLFNKNGRLINTKDYIKKVRHDKDGYNCVCLNLGNGILLYRKVHRLVAEAFIPNPNNYPIINHKNEVKDDNSVDNLEWCDQKHNMNYGTVKERISVSRKEYCEAHNCKHSPETRKKMSVAASNRHMEKGADGKKHWIKTK